MQDKKYPLLDTVNCPDDVKKMSAEQANALADEIREYLVDTVSVTGGHLASNLGVVELTLALHRVFDSPRDKIVWDVGHQSYVHKLLTGRRDRFATLRTSGGLSGFTKRDESEHDPFGAGHSSTSISAALGIAEAQRMKNGKNYTVAVVGDGAFTGGMIHEALNNCDEHSGLRLIVVINENEMSISKNIGSFAKSISKIRMRPGYFRTKAATRGFLKKIPLIGKPIVSLIVGLKKSLKNLLYGSNYFENLGLYYLGPVDGNDREAVENLLREAKKCGGSAVVHLKTKKGKGYAPAEADPDRFHSVAPKDSARVAGFSAEFGNIVCEMAAKDERICAITAAMSQGTGLTRFENEYAERFFDVGIAEEHAVTFAAGLAADGMRPVCAIYSTFLQRAYDNVLHDVALQRLPVLICIDRAGLNSGDGATHHGVFDVSFLSGIPSLKIYTPATYGALRRAMTEALALDAPAAIRYPCGTEDERVVKAFYMGSEDARIGIRTAFIEDDTDRMIIVHGRMASTALDVRNTLAEKGVSCGVILCEYIAPYSELAAEIMSLLPNGARVLIAEEEILQGGFAMNLADSLRTLGCTNKISIRAVENAFVTPNTSQSIFEATGVDKDSLVKILM
ncbi:MAG: 1-deoxy-D-xylulose-5-phosphate synthase [Clostridia bacterium]|nr:1-deoxy-D-xylulose-5-phosphate synthase [Clostridia bacterium]